MTLKIDGLKRDILDAKWVESLQDEWERNSETMGIETLDSRKGRRKLRENCTLPVLVTSALFPYWVCLSVDKALGTSST